MQQVMSASRRGRSEGRAVVEAVRALILKSLSITVESDEQDLLTAGLLDSLNLVRLISQIEDTFGLALPISEVGLESFRSVACIAELIEDRRAPSRPGVEGANGLASEIRALLEENLSVRVQDIDTDLFHAGYLDSMSLVQLILELESHFELLLPMQDLDLAAFRSVASITELIDRRKRGGAVSTVTG